MSLNKRMLPWNILLGASMAAMICTLIYDKTTPMPAFNMSGDMIASQEKKLRLQINSLYEEAKESTAMLQNRVWTGDAKLIGPKAMSTATRIATKHQVKLSAFRPQKSVQEGTLVRYPFVMSLEGTYPQVLGFVRDLEQPQNRLVVNVVQIASADGSSSAVNAIVNVWALQPTPETVKKPATRKPNV